MRVSWICSVRLKSACVVIHRFGVAVVLWCWWESAQSACPLFFFEKRSESGPCETAEKQRRLADEGGWLKSRSAIRTAAGGVCPLGRFFTRVSVLVSAGVHLIAAWIICCFIAVALAVVEMSQLVKVVIFLVVSVVVASSTLTGKSSDRLFDLSPYLEQSAVRSLCFGKFRGRMQVLPTPRDV